MLDRQRPAVTSSFKPQPRLLTTQQSGSQIPAAVSSPGFHLGRRVICSVNHYTVLRNADPRGSFEVGRLINVFKQGCPPASASAGSWEMNVIMNIINQGQAAWVAPLVGTGDEGTSMVHADDPKTAWVMLPLTLRKDI